MLKLSVQVGDAIVRREDTARTSVFVVEPFVETYVRHKSLSPATLLWCGECASSVAAGFCQTPARAVFGAVVH